MTPQRTIALAWMLAISALAFGRQTPPPPTTATISGTVLDAESKPVGGATVTIGTSVFPLATPGGATIAKTDDAGNYRFAGMFPGTYSMTIEADGYVSIPSGTRI